MKLCESKNEEMLIENIELHKTVGELKGMLERCREKKLYLENKG